MSVIFKLLIVSLVLTNMTFALRPIPASASAVLPSNQGLARLFMNSRLTAQNPEQSMACFGAYIGNSNTISETYSKEYNRCLQRSADQRKQIEKEVSLERRTIQQAADAICARVNLCNKFNSSLDMFSCHAETGSNNTKISYTISTNASDYVTLLQERYRTISLTEEKCCSNSERIYVKRTTNNYDVLQACLDGKVRPKPPTPATTTPTSTTTNNTTTTVATITEELEPNTQFPTDVELIEPLI